MSRSGILQLGVSLAFAAMMICSALFIGDKETKQMVVFLLTAVWWIPYSTIAGQDRCCCRSSRKESCEG